MPEGIEIGKAYVQIVPSAEGISGSISNLIGPESEKAGEKAGGSFSGAFAGALKGTGAVLAGTAVAIGGVTAALVSGVSSTAEYADSIDKASQKLGISSTAYQEWEAVLQHSGTSMDAMSSTFRTLAKASQDSTADQEQAFKRLGLSLDEISGMSADELFGSVIAGLQNMEEGTERTAIASTLLGRGAMEMGALLNTSAEDTQAMIDRVHELGGVLSEDAIKNGAAFTDALQDMNTALEGLKNGALAELLPSFTQIMNGLTAIFAGEDGGMKDISLGIIGITNTITSALPTIIEIGGELTSQLLQSIITNLPQITGSAVRIIESLVNGLLDNNSLQQLSEVSVSVIMELVNFILDNLDLLVSTSIDIVLALAEGITSALPGLISKISTILPTVISTILNRLPEILKLGTLLLSELVKGILSALPELISQAPKIMSEFTSALLSMLDLLITCGVELISALTGPEALPQIIEAVSGAAPDIIMSLLGAIAQLYPMVISAGLDLFMALLQNMPDVYIEVGKAVFSIVNGIIDKLVESWPDISQAGQDALFSIFDKISDVIDLAKNKVGEIVSAIKTEFENVIEDFKTIGNWIIEGIWSGISDKVDWLKENLGGFADEVVNGVKGFFDINSPSKRMANDVGKFLPEGIAVGITANTDAVTNAMDELSNSTIGIAKRNISINSGTFASASISSGDSSLYKLLATYLPEIAENRIKAELEVKADADRMFTVMQKKAKQYSKSTRLPAF